jgi:DNA-damage-inducible protein D
MSRLAMPSNCALRDLHYLLSHSNSDKLLNILSRAKSACEISGHLASNHIAEARKMVDFGSGSRSARYP